jgi:Cu-Zn family superoxide dismutase
MVSSSLVRKLGCFSSLLALLTLVDCAHREPVVLAEASSAPAAALARTATATLMPLGKSAVSGSFILTELVDGGVRVVGTVHGLESGGLHGFHVHAKGDCSAPDGSSAGGHFNPQDKPHGDPGTAASHLGDLGNVQADHAGNAEVFVVKKEANLGDGPLSFIGRSLIVHRGVDDLASQPAGNSGDRVGCAVIRRSRE